MVGDFAAATGQPGLVESMAPLAVLAPVQGQPVKTVAAGPGRFILVYGPAKTAQAKKWKKILQDSKIYDDNVRLLNTQLSLPFDLVIEAKQCNKPDAWYEPNEHKVYICYEELADAARLLKARVSPKSAADHMALGDATHTFYHELGHALIDIYNLPTTGREEDAVDQFATLVLLSSGEEGEVAAEIAAMQFLQSGTEDRSLPFSDEHSFDKQRYYDILCLIYGKDPDKHADMVSKKILPQERAERCQDEYQHLDAAWDTLLAPHLKTPPSK